MSRPVFALVAVLFGLNVASLAVRIAQDNTVGAAAAAFAVGALLVVLAPEVLDR